MRAKIEIPSYVTCIVIEVAPFESRIVEEQEFQKNVPAGMIAVIATL